MGMKRARSINAPAPARRPWSLGVATLAMVVYGGVAIQDAGRPAPPPEPVVLTEATAWVMDAITTLVSGIRSAQTGSHKA